MEQEKNYISQFINKSSVTKTLNFGLIPVGNTSNNIENGNFIEQDFHRAESYNIVKGMIDEYHKYFISKVIVDLKLVGLDEYNSLYNTIIKDDLIKNRLKVIQTSLYKQVSSIFTSNSEYEKLFKKELITKDLVKIFKSDENISVLNEFKNFTSYFANFHEIRKHIYTGKGKVGTIGFRIVDQNLPKFIDNINNFNKLLDSTISSELGVIQTNLSIFLKVADIKDVFNIDYFNNVLSQEDIDNYNYILGGYSITGKDKVKGLNEYIEEYNKTVDKKYRIGKLKKLYKQILSDKSILSYQLDKIESDEQALGGIVSYYEIIETDVLTLLKQLLLNLDSYDLNGIYISNDSKILYNISKKVFGNQYAIENGLQKYFEGIYTGTAKIGSDKYINARVNFFKNKENFSLQFVNDCVSLNDTTDYKFKNIQDYFKQSCGNDDNLFNEIAKSFKVIEELLYNPSILTKKLSNHTYYTTKIKDFLDSIKTLQDFIKMLSGSESEVVKDDDFYNNYSQLSILLDGITPLYDKIRNYVTVKAYSDDKIKLNFNNQKLLGGWDIDTEDANGTILLRKAGNYYLLVMDRKHSTAFDDAVYIDASDSSYERLIYAYIGEPSKMLPKKFFSQKHKDLYNPDQRVLDIRENKTHLKGSKNFSIDDCHYFIDFFKNCIAITEKYTKYFSFNFSDTSTYNDISDFYKEITKPGYIMYFNNVSDTFVDNLVNDGKGYLFKIHNKDYSESSNGNKNLNTIYWEALFSQNNINDIVHKLNGCGEIFFRRKSISDSEKIVHLKNQPINNKNKNNPKKQSVFTYDIIKDKRYTEDTYHFHVPITLNYNSENVNNINTHINKCIKESEVQTIIGIDLGERNLVYVNVINNDGKILEQRSLNVIKSYHDGVEHTVDYHDMLSDKEKERKNARLSWDTIENIKELKDGYLGLAVHEIIKMVLTYPNPVIVIEDLNSGFTNSRKKVEIQVYERFVAKLISKLNLIVDKSRTDLEVGGALKAIQLTNHLNGDRLQNGILFRVNPWNTSKIDPVTGFVDILRPKYETIEKSKSFFEKFESIKYNSEKNYFEFSFDYKKFTKVVKGERTKWVVCTNGERVVNYKSDNRWLSDIADPTKLLKDLFVNCNIDLNSDNLITEILNQKDSTFFKKILFILGITLKIRNSITGTNIDYLLSCVQDKNGNFYDSRLVGDDLPKDADSNGAYNIARKGLMSIIKIKECDDLSKLKIAITEKEWLIFAQNN